MIIALTIFNYLMWGAIVVYLIVGTLSILARNHDSNRILVKSTIIICAMVLVFSLTRFILAAIIDVEGLATYFVFVPIWIIATIMQIHRLSEFKE